MDSRLEALANAYRAAYIARDPSRVAIAPDVRFSENNVEMGFPDASWDAVTEEVGPALTFSDPTTGNAGFFTAIAMNDTLGFLAARLRIRGGRIVEVEHMLSTRRNLSGPPTPIRDARAFV